MNQSAEKSFGLEKQTDGEQGPKAGNQQGDFEAQGRHVLLTLFEGYRDLSQGCV